MNHRIKFLLLVMGLLLLVAVPSVACSDVTSGAELLEGIEHDTKFIIDRAKDVTENVFHVYPCQPGDGMCLGDVLDKANEYGQNGGK